MTIPLRFDHAVILVNDLEQAISDYQALGFNVFYGGEHAGGLTHNALIVFQDGTYLELLAPTHPDLLKQIDPNDRSNFLFMFERGEGFGGYALLSQNLEGDVAGMENRGLKVQLRSPGGRVTPTGEELRWRSAMLDGSMTPFFIQDDTPRFLRVTKDPDLQRQPNGISGIAGIMIPYSDLNSGVNLYSTILGNPPQQQDSMSADFALEAITITLVAPTNDDQNLGDYLAQHGEVPYKLWLWTSVGEKAGELDTMLTHGVQLELMA
jgi:hypothetical protein